MPKMKSHSGSAKRFKRLKSGLVKFTKPGRRHLLTKKTAKSKRGMRRSAYITGVDMPHMKSVFVS